MFYWILILVISQIQSYLPEIDQELRFCGKIKLHELTIEKVHRYYLSGKLTPQMLVDCYKSRIERMNLGLGNIIEVNKDLQDIKHDSNMTWIPQPLYGIPIIISGSITTNDSMTTSYLKYTLPYKQRRDALIIKHLKQEGAIILGKARGNLTEFSNPYNLRKKNRGCSAGVAVTSNLAMLGISVDSEKSTLAAASDLSLVAIRMVRKDVLMDGVLVDEPFKNTVVLLARTTIDCFKLYKLASLSAYSEPKDLVSPLDSNHYLENKLYRYSPKLAGILHENLFKSTHTLQAPYLREVEQRMNRSNIQVSRQLFLSSESVACIQSTLKPIDYNQLDTRDENFTPNLSCKLDPSIKKSTLSEINTILTTHGLEAIILPAPIGEFLPEFPILTIPAGNKPDSIPYGLSLVTKIQWSESLFNIGYRIESVDLTLRYRPNFLN